MADTRIDIIAEWLDRQVADSSITDGRIWRDMAVSERTFYRLKPKAVLLQQQRAEIRRKEVEQVNLQAATEAAKMGLKTKNDRVLILQTEVDNCLQELSANVEYDYPVIGGKVQKVSRPMTVFERAKLRQTVYHLQSEISKIEGDYAPDKKEITGKDGQPLVPETKLTPEQLERLIDKL